MEEFCAKWHSQFLSVLRIMTGLLFLEHGTGKYLGFPHLERVPEPMSMGCLLYTSVAGWYWATSCAPRSAWSGT